MSRGIFKNAVNVSHLIIKEVVKEGDTVVDATCGRGKDTLFLARLVGERGKVYAFDIQESAIESTRKLLVENHVLERVMLIKDDHRNIGKYLECRPKACMFNLGYLPGGERGIKTKADATVTAIQNVIHIMPERGIITVVLYSRHHGGQREIEVVRDFLSGLPQMAFEVTEIRFINQKNNPPQIIIVQKIRDCWSKS